MALCRSDGSSFLLAELVSPSPSGKKDAGNEKRVSNNLVLELLDWIEANSIYDVSAIRRNPPKISFCRGQEMIRYEGKEILVDDILMAAFDKSARVIFLVEPWSADNPFNVATLLHELIHAVQLRESNWLCDQQTEWQAYKLQEAWLQDRDLDPEFNWAQIFLLSRCPRDVHP